METCQGESSMQEVPIRDKGNYRPISVLCALSEILERHVHDSLYNYLVSHNMLYGGQSGFCAQHSCETVLSYMVHKWASAIDRGLLNGIVLLDLWKAFDLVNYEILLEKLEIYGCSAGSLTWFPSYLTGRKQMVSFWGHLSDMATVTVGVLQGSILGPFFFIIFMNDMPLNTGSGDPVNMYGDDSTASASGSTLEHLEASLNNDLENVLQWCNHRRRNGGGARGVLPPTFQGGGGRRRSLPPHFWACTYLKIPPRSLFFHPHHSTVLTPNQSVRRCFEKFIYRHRDPGGGQGTQPPSVSPVHVCVGGVEPHAGSPFRPVLQCPAI